MEANETHPGLLQGITRSYVDGFLFSLDKQKVVLIRKNHPDWMKGKLNAVGGKIEPGEEPRMAMIREFKEETGVEILGWNHYLVLGGSGFKVHCYWAVAHEKVLRSCHTMGDEEIEMIDLDCLHLHGLKMTNLDWMIHMALSMPKERAAGFEVQEVYGKP